MNLTGDQVMSIRPKLVERHCGGWLAVSESGSQLRIAVTGETEDEARHKFSDALAEWRVIFEAWDAVH